MVISKVDNQMHISNKYDNFEQKKIGKIDSSLKLNY
jgi:hypothetical protein